MIVVTVDFQIQPGQMSCFMPQMLDNAQASLDHEKGCLQFDVCVSEKDDHHVFLYEIYRLREDFNAHLLMPHFIRFNASTASLVAQKTVRIFERAAAQK